MQCEGGSALALIGADVGHRRGEAAAHLGRGLELVVAVALAGRADAEVDNTEKLLTYQERGHDGHVDLDALEVDLWAVPVRLANADALDHSVVHVEEHRPAGGERLMRRVVPAEFYEDADGLRHVRRQGWGGWPVG